jgi:hypothetical protein
MHEARKLNVNSTVLLKNLNSISYSKKNAAKESGKKYHTW